MPDISWALEVLLVNTKVLDVDQARVIAAIADGTFGAVVLGLVVVLGVVAPFLLRKAWLWLDASRNDANWGLLARVADHAVLSAEQTLAGDNAAKFAHAANVVSEAAHRAGVKGFTPEVCKVLIESAVFGLRKSLPVRRKPTSKVAVP